MRKELSFGPLRASQHYLQLRNGQRHPSPGTGPTQERRQPRGRGPRGPGLLPVHRRRRHPHRRVLHRRRERLPASGRAPPHPSPDPAGDPEVARVPRREPRAARGCGKRAAAAGAGVQQEERAAAAVQVPEEVLRGRGRACRVF